MKFISPPSELHIFTLGRNQKEAVKCCIVRAKFFVYKLQHSCTKCIAHLYLRLPVVLVQKQSVWDRFQTFVVLEESSTLSDGCNCFN